jgi:hypothetical protein
VAEAGEPVVVVEAVPLVWYPSEAARQSALHHANCSLRREPRLLLHDASAQPGSGFPILDARFGGRCGAQIHLQFVVAYLRS